MLNMRWIRAFALLLAACQASGSEPAAPDDGARDDRSPELSPPSEGTGSAIVANARPAPQSGAPGNVRPEEPPVPSIRVEAAGSYEAPEPAAPDLEAEPVDGVEHAERGGVDLEDTVEDPVIEGALQRSAWDEFKERSSRVADDGTVFYLVEWDLPVHTETELRAYYDAMVAGEQDKGVVFQLPGSIDDVWQGIDVLLLRYCVDTNTTTGFGAATSQVSSATMIAAMEEATRAWERVANVRFEYDPSRNNNCGVGASVPDTTYFKVARQDTLATVFAFTPSGQTAPGLDGRTIGTPSQYINSIAPPGFTWPGTMMHELGHVLGFAHEHFHTNGGDCASPSPARDVTASVDLFSIMGYPKGNPGTPACAQTTPNLTALSMLDGWTARTFYGAPPAWHLAYAPPMLE